MTLEINDKHMKKNLLLVFFTSAFLLFAFLPKEKPTLWLIGDSTVADGSGNNGLWGWGRYLHQFIDTNKIYLRNYAQGGTSTRTFRTGGIWDKKLNRIGMWDSVYPKLKSGDYLLIQFGINDQSPVDDSTRSRGTLHGIGDDSVSIFNKITQKQETVHSFGWYIKQFIVEAKAKGVTVIVCTSIPKNVWKEGKLLRGEYGFCSWSIESAKQEKAFTIDLNNLIGDIYEKEGETIVTKKYHIAKDNTHTIEAGAILNASVVAKGIKELKGCKLKKYLVSN